MHYHKIISNVLINLGNLPTLEGFHYLKECIESSIADKSRLTNLYKMTAQKHNTTATAIERAIRFSINATWHKRNRDFASEIFGCALQSDTDSPTNGLYIAVIAEWVRCQT